MELNENENNCKVTVKTPKRILHFSDGTLEEYSDSEEPEQGPKSEDAVDTANMGWGPWMIHKALSTGSSTLSACDYVGEALASFLGITTPKYQYELDEHIRMQRKRKSEAEDVWLNANESNEATVVTTRPVATDNTKTDT